MPKTKEVPFQTLFPPATAVMIVNVFGDAGALVLPVTLVALITKFEVPALVGVPVMAPVEVFKFTPAGNEPETIL